MQLESFLDFSTFLCGLALRVLRTLESWYTVMLENGDAAVGSWLSATLESSDPGFRTCVFC